MIDTTFAMDTARTIAQSTSQVQRTAGTSGFQGELDSALTRFNNRGGSGTRDEQLRSASVELESIFVAQMFKEMRKAVPKTEWLNGGHAEKIFEDMLYDEYALQVSKNARLGLAQQIYEEMSRTI